jgi:hypothetical protein
MTSQLSPQMAAQQYRPQEFHSSHQTYQSNESTAYPSEYGQHSTPEQLYAMSHLNMQTLSQTQTPIPTQLVHRSPVIERRLDISQTQTLQQNINPDLSHYKREVNTSHVSQMKTQSFLSCVPTEPILQNSEDIIDFDDVSLAVDPTNEVQYNQSIASFEQNPNEFEMPVPSGQFHHHINDNQSFEEQSIESQDLAKDETDTDETYQSDTNDNTNDSISEDQIKPIESNFSDPQIIAETSFPVSEPQSETMPKTNHQIIDETHLQEVNESTTDSSDGNETDVDSQKEDEEYIDNNANNNALIDSVTNEESVTIDEDLEPQLNQNSDHKSVIKEVNNEIEDNLKTIDDESKSSETSEEQEVSVPENDNSIETSKASEISVKPIVPPINQINRSKQDENRPPVRTAVVRAEPHINEVSVIQNATKNEIKNNKKLTKNQKKKLRKKNRANKRKLEREMQTQANEDDDRMDIDDDEDEEEVEIE